MDFCLQSKTWSSIIQVTLILVATILGVGLLVTGVIISYKFGPQSNDQPLLLKLHSLTLSNLNLSDSLSSATWDTKLLYANKASTFEILIQSQESTLCYKYQNDSKALSCTTVEPITVGPERQRLMRIKFNNTGCVGGQPYIEDRVVEEIKKDVANGTLHFKLKMDLLVVYRRGLLAWHYHFEPDCGDLEVKIQRKTGNGYGGSVTDCPHLCSVELSN